MAAAFPKPVTLTAINVFLLADGCCRILMSETELDTSHQIHYDLLAQVAVGGST
jgi:hypothetical protein